MQITARKKHENWLKSKDRKKDTSEAVTVARRKWKINMTGGNVH